MINNTPLELLPTVDPEIAEAARNLDAPDPVWNRIANRLRKEKDWCDASFQRGRIAFLQMMLLAKFEGGDISPDCMADEVWHTFLLYTKDYQDWCKKHFGRFIHHHPFSDDEAVRSEQEFRSAERTSALHRLYFAAPAMALAGGRDCSTPSCSSPSCHQCHGCGITS